jgi:predicted house-cleaning NTP pyrophosphatase (Maf/HAM1 superfamily)
VRFRGVERRDVEEYSVSEGWIRAAAGKALDRRGQPLVIKMTGPVEPYFLVNLDESANPTSE